MTITKPYLSLGNGNKVTNQYKINRRLWIDNKMYLVNLSNSSIENILLNVFTATLSKSGNVYFNKNRYLVKEFQILRNLLTNFLGCAEPTECEITDSDFTSDPE